jgi:hypothetical protein
VAADGLAVGAGDLASAIRVDGQRPAELVEQHMMVPPAIVFQVGEAGGAAVGPVDDVVRFAPGGGLVAAAGMLAALVPQGHQAAEVDRDVVGLVQCQRQIPRVTRMRPDLSFGAALRPLGGNVGVVAAGELGTYAPPGRQCRDGW